MLSQQFVDQLFENPYFQQKLHEQILIKISQPSTNFQNNESKGCHLLINNVIEQIQCLLMQQHKLSLDKQVSDIYQTSHQICNQISSLKARMSVIQNTQFTNKSTPQKKHLNGSQNAKQQQIETNYRTNFENLGESFSIQNQPDFNILKRNVQGLQQKINQINLSTSFAFESQLPQQQIFQRINLSLQESLSKVQHNLQQRVSKLEKELGRRIDHIMKTMRSLFDMINENPQICLQKNKRKVNNDSKLSILGNYFGFAK